MKILESVIFIQVLAFGTFCDADDFGAKTFESVFLNNLSKDIKEMNIIWKAYKHRELYKYCNFCKLSDVDR